MTSYLKLPYLKQREEELSEPKNAQLLADAKIAISIAQKARRTWRWKKPSARRTYELMTAFDGLTMASRPLSTRLRRSVYKSYGKADRLEAIVADIYREKKKLYKMVPPGTLSSKL